MALALLRAAVEAPAPLGADILAFQPGDGLVEPLGAVAVAGIVRGVAEAGIGDLLLQLNKLLVIGLRQVREIERLVLHLPVEAFQRGPAVEKLGELLLDLGLRGLGLQEGDALERARPLERLEQPAMAAAAHQRGEFLRRDAVIAEDRLGEEAKELGKLPLPDVEMRHFLGEMIEQRGVMGERQDDGDGKAMG